MLCSGCLSSYFLNVCFVSFYIVRKALGAIILRKENITSTDAMFLEYVFLFLTIICRISLPMTLLVLVHRLKKHLNHHCYRCILVVPKYLL